jgi:hypothetical protein
MFSIERPETMATAPPDKSARDYDGIGSGRQLDQRAFENQKKSSVLHHQCGVSGTN